MTAHNIIQTLGSLPEAQHGYFTRPQAIAVGIANTAIHKAVTRGVIQRISTGIYKVSGTGTIQFEELWVAWLRLSNKVDPRSRTLDPNIWVSHESAATLHGFGDFIADEHHFITESRKKPRYGIKLHRRSKGLQPQNWTVINGFAVTSVEQTASDLLQSKTDGGHVGQFIREALSANATTKPAILKATKLTESKLNTLLNQ